MGTFVTGDCTVGVWCADVGNVLHRSGSGGATLQVGVVGHVPADWEGAGRISTLGNTAADGEDATEEWVWYLDTPSPGGGDGGGYNVVYRNLSQLYPEHCCKIYWDKANDGPVSGGGVRFQSGGDMKR